MIISSTNLGVNGGCLVDVNIKGSAVHGAA